MFAKQKPSRTKHGDAMLYSRLAIANPKSPVTKNISIIGGVSRQDNIKNNNNNNKNTGRKNNKNGC
ncbi:MAG: hypothetical protein A2X77_03445 [Gammaproteobacteria bacterium GWE2_42_36]|nr:MAG: hypothetical protein A2X77_03445 [Gammaproteobacteria bacterium GWE2_42_36]HCU04730.1 hypothetical protein [Coxiellaceae bacterium]